MFSGGENKNRVKTSEKKNFLFMANTENETLHTKTKCVAKGRKATCLLSW